MELKNDLIIIEESKEKITQLQERQEELNKKLNEKQKLLNELERKITDLRNEFNEITSTIESLPNLDKDLESSNWDSKEKGILLNKKSFLSKKLFNPKFWLTFLKSKI